MLNVPRSTGRYIAYQEPALQKFEKMHQAEIISFVKDSVKIFANEPKQSRETKIRESLFAKFSELKDPKFNELTSNVVGSVLLYLNRKS